MRSTQSKVTVVVPTLAAKERAESLARAVASIRASSSDAVKILVVVNGDVADETVTKWLKAQPDLAIARIPEASLPLAIAHGRSLVDTSYFSFLDDDDQYLPGATDVKLRLMEQQVADVVISNGYSKKRERPDDLVYRHLSTVASDPLGTLLKENWLNSCNSLFSTQNIGRSYFDNGRAYLEWTWLAFQLVVSGARIATTETPTFVINNTPGSLSKSVGRYEACEELFSSMLAQSLPKPLERRIIRKICANRHAESMHWLRCNELARAWKCHVRSLFYLRGLQYLPYTTHVLAKFVTKAFAAPARSTR